MPVLPHSRRIIFGMKNKINLTDHIILPVNLGNGLYKCRIIYAQEVQKVEFLPYIPKSVRTLQIVYSDAIQYEHKFLDRSGIENLLQGTRDAGRYSYRTAGIDN